MLTTMNSLLLGTMPSCDVELASYDDDKYSRFLLRSHNDACAYLEICLPYIAEFLIEAKRVTQLIRLKEQASGHPSSGEINPFCKPDVRVYVCIQVAVFHQLVSLHGTVDVAFTCSPWPLVP
jgi:hypothetical protein